MGLGVTLSALQGARQLAIVLAVVVTGVTASRAASRRPRRRAYLAVSVVAALSALVLVATAAAPRGPSGGGEPPAGASDSAHGASPTGASEQPDGREQGGATPGDDTSLEATPCRSRDGMPAACTVAGTALAAAVSQCSPAGVASAWGLDPELDTLLLTTEAQGAECWVRPDDVATAAGASALDLERARSGRVPAVLRECARQEGGSPVTCRDRHELEFIGSWRAEDVTDPSQHCREAAVRYTARTLSGAGHILRGVALTGATSTGERRVRCAVASDVTLDDSVRSLGGGEVPTAAG